MIHAATLPLHSSLSSVPPTSCSPPASPATLLTSEMFLVLRCKGALNVFNHIQPLFSLFLRPFPLLSASSSLFFAKQGGRGINLLPNYTAPKKMRTSSKAAYSLFAINGGLPHAETPPCTRPG